MGNFCNDREFFGGGSDYGLVVVVFVLIVGLLKIFMGVGSFLLAVGWPRNQLEFTNTHKITETFIFLSMLCLEMPPLAKEPTIFK